MLTDTKVRNARPREKGYKLADSAGLHLFVSPSGGKLWRYRYEFAGKEKLLSLGPYPENTLLDARVSRDAARAILREAKRLLAPIAGLKGDDLDKPGMGLDSIPVPISTPASTAYFAAR
jgi:hypothetical protein